MKKGTELQEDQRMYWICSNYYYFLFVTFQNCDFQRCYFYRNVYVCFCICKFVCVSLYMDYCLKCYEPILNVFSQEVLLKTLKRRNFNKLELSVLSRAHAPLSLFV